MIRVGSHGPGVDPTVGFRTGLDGKFILRDVRPGIVNFYIAKPGYAPGPYASARSIADGEHIDGVVLAGRPAASVSGRVLDESGQPAVGAIVTVPANLGRTPADPVATPATEPIVIPKSATSVTTDDEGRYWIGGLDAGELNITVRPYGNALGLERSSEAVFVAANVRGKPVAVTVPTTGSQFLTLSLDVGENLTDTDLIVRFPPTLGPSDTSSSATASISGRVIDVAGRRVAHAIVVMTPVGEGGLMSASTDTDGVFQFLNVPAGSFTLGARTASSLSASLDPQGPALTPLSVAAGSLTENVVLTVRKGAVMSGTITDEFGEPAWASVVVAGPYGNESGMTGRVSNTDARGRFRIAGLVPGEYLVVAEPVSSGEIHFDHGGQDRVLANVPVFFPGVNKASLASRITVAEDIETADVDLALRASPVANINVTIATDRPLNDIQLHYIVLDDQILSVRKTIRVAGSDVTLKVAPGRYRLLATAEIPSSGEAATRLWASAEVDADSLLAVNVPMTLAPAARLSGRLVFEGISSATRQGAGPGLASMQQGPGPMLGLPAGDPTFDTDTGRFSIEAVMPGQYVIQAGRAERNRSPWMLKAATVRGRDVLDEPIDIAPGEDITDVRLTVTDRINELSGTVTDATGKPSRDSWVAVLSVDRKYWLPGSRRLRVVRPDAKGHYVIRALPPGSYFVTLVPEPAPQDLTSKLPELAAAGMRVSILEGERKVQDLRTRK